MAGYLDTRQMIIDTLMGRPEGTQVQPEDHQAYALNLLNYVRSVELSSGSTLTGIAEADTVPIEPYDSRVAYITSVPQNTVRTFTYFKKENNEPITITTTNSSVFVILLWNTQYWEYQPLPVTVFENDSFVGYFKCTSLSTDVNKTISSEINQLTTDMRILVKMNNINTQDNATLQIGLTNAKPLYYNGLRASSTNSWAQNEVLDIYYDGTNYVATTYGGAQFKTGEKVGDVGIDDEPTAGSDNLVKSGGVVALTDRDKVKWMNGLGILGAEDVTVKYIGSVPKTTNITILEFPVSVGDLIYVSYTNAIVGLQLSFAVGTQTQSLQNIIPGGGRAVSAEYEAFVLIQKNCTHLRLYNLSSAELYVNIFKVTGSLISDEVESLQDEVESLQDEVALGAVYDVSVKNPTAGPNNDGKWESLSALLSDANLNTLIPTAYRKGGMSIKFIQSSDNKYVQYRLMSATFSTTVSDWQGVDDVPTTGSRNLAESRGVVESEQKLFLQELVGAVYNTWNTNDGQTHYVIPVNGGETVSFDNVANAMYYGLLKTYSTPISGATPDFCNGYTGRQSANESTNINIPSDCRFLVINNPNGNNTLTSLIINGVDVVNGVHGSISNLGRTIGENKKDFLQYNIPAYPCFVARTASHNDIEIPVVGATGKAYLSAVLRSFISLSLTGFDKTKVHFVSLFRNGYNSGNEYQIEFSTLDNGTVTQIERFYIPVQQITTPEGVNVIDVTSNNHRIRATLDLSVFPNGGATNLRSVDYSNFIVRKDCFFNIDDVVKDEDLTIKSVNLANPINIDDGHYITNTGGVGSNVDWSLITVTVKPETKYTFGGFYLGRSGFGIFIDNNGTRVGGVLEYNDPKGRQSPTTVTAQSGAKYLIIDIKTGNSPSDAYSALMINEGETLLPYVPYTPKISKINNIPIQGADDEEIEDIKSDIETLQSEVEDIQSQIVAVAEDLIADLPVSDGTDISVGYAYIDSSTGIVKIKL